MRSQRNSRRGQTALLFTLSATSIFAMVGLVTDVGYVYYRKQAAQAAAQAAALASVKWAFHSSGGNFTCGQNSVVCYNDEHSCPTTISGYGSNNVEAGCLYAMQDDYTPSNTKKVTFQSGTGSVSGVSVTFYTIVRVSEKLPLLFSAVTGNTSTTLTARSIVGYIPATTGGCVYVIAPTGASLTMNGNTSLTTGCGVWDDSSDANAINMSGGNTQITATGGSTVQIVGGYNCYGGTTGCITPSPTTGASNSGDPMAGLDPPNDSGTCTAVPTLNNKTAVTQTNPTGTVVFCGAVSIANNQELDLSPGTYVFKNGGLSVAGQGTLKSTGGVTLYFEGTNTVSISGGATVTLSAPTSGTYNGVLMYQDRADTATASLTGGSGQILQGVIYFPDALLHYTGGSSTVSNSQAMSIVAYNLSIDGNSYIQSAGTSPYLSEFSGFAVIE